MQKSFNWIYIFWVLCYFSFMCLRYSLYQIFLSFLQQNITINTVCLSVCTSWQWSLKLNILFWLNFTGHIWHSASLELAFAAGSSLPLTSNTQCTRPLWPLLQVVSPRVPRRLFGYARPNACHLAPPPGLAPGRALGTRVWARKTMNYWYFSS